MDNPIILSIITVNYNSGKKLKRTLSELKEYAIYEKVEIILIDGNSTDCSFSDAIAYQNKNIKYISERDNGIFDAMNKGIKFSRGNWVWFINAGDTPLIKVSEVLELIQKGEKEKSNFIYSDLIFDKKIIVQNLNIKTLFLSMINHQNIIYRKELLKDGYDSSFKYCADYHHLLNKYKIIIPYKSGHTICHYDVDGISSILSRRTRVKLWMERIKAQRNAQIFLPLKFLLISVSLIAIIIKLINPRIGSITPSNGE